MPSVLNDSEGGGDRNQINKSLSETIVTSSSVTFKDAKTSDKEKDAVEEEEGEKTEFSKNFTSSSTSSSDSSFTKNSTDEDTEEKDSSLEDLLADREKNRKPRIKKDQNPINKEHKLRGELFKKLSEVHSKTSHEKGAQMQYKVSGSETKISGEQVDSSTKDSESRYPQALTSSLRIETKNKEVKRQNIDNPENIEEKDDSNKVLTDNQSQKLVEISETLENELEVDKKVRLLKADDLPPVPSIQIIDVAEVGGHFTSVPNETALEDMRNVLPYFVRGRVVNGFGRGSRELGIPTANFSSDVVKDIHTALLPGVYFGWAKVDPWPVMKMVMNLGWNPFFENIEKSLEVHILYKFPFDFYGAHMRICILGYMRAEAKFNSMDDLIKAIRRDMNIANSLLDKPECYMYSMHEFFGCDCEELSKH